jgi:3-phenylpropionate/trans-cinnamate dioxygenase ferredoxin reductase subunit
MSNPHVKYLLIGGGVASSEAADAIRSVDRAGSLLLIGQEINRPYHRPLLSRQYLKGEANHEALFLQDAQWYAARDIELRTGRRASHLDVTRQTVTFDSGEEISFDRLLIATGASPAKLNVPGADLPNVYYLRTVGDADRLRHAVLKALHEGRPHVRGRGRSTVVGAGLLGVELAATLTQIGLAVDLVCPDGHVWSRFAGEILGGLMARFLTANGITVHAAARPVRLEGDGRVQRVVLSNGQTLATDLVAAATGVVASKQLLRGTAVSAETAILTDAHCCTSVPGVYAAGDCAAIFDPLFGKHRQLDHWHSAVDTGRVAGRNMAGVDEAYSAVNRFGSDVFGLELAGWGEARLVARRIVRGTPSAENASMVEVGVAADGRVAQVVAVGEAIDRGLLPELVRLRVHVDGNEERIKDPSFGMRGLVG